MNMEKACYETVIMFGNMQDFLMKLQRDGKTLGEIINDKNQNGLSLLGRSICSRKFDIAKYLLSNGATVNNVTKDGNNEFHVIAPHLDLDGAVEIARILLEKGTSLTVKDKKYGNSALFSLCLEACQCRSDEPKRFVEDCFKYIQESGDCSIFDSCNKAGISIRTIVNQWGTDGFKKILEGQK